MRIARELTRFVSFLKRLFKKLPGEAAEAKDTLDATIRVLSTARAYVPDTLKDEMDVALNAVRKLRNAADLVEEL